MMNAKKDNKDYYAVYAISKKTTIYQAQMYVKNVPAPKQKPSK